MRAQMMAMSERLDRLEAENRALAAANAELTKDNAGNCRHRCRCQ